MPLTAVPQGVEIRKLSAAQKRALDKLLESQNGSSTKNTALAVGITTIALALGGMAIYSRMKLKKLSKRAGQILRNLLKESLLECLLELLMLVLL